VIHWQLDRYQAQRMRDWLEYLEDVVEEDDDDWPMLERCRAEIESLLHQDALANPVAQQPPLDNLAP
jgi:hypothetical protein